MVAPWKVMLALSGILVVVGAFVHLGISEPWEVVAAIVLLAMFAVMTFIGYTLGKRIGPGSN